MQRETSEAWGKRVRQEVLSTKCDCVPVGKSTINALLLFAAEMMREGHTRYELQTSLNIMVDAVMDTIPQDDPEPIIR